MTPTAVTSRHYDRFVLLIECLEKLLALAKAQKCQHMLYIRSMSNSTNLVWYDRLIVTANVDQYIGELLLQMLQYIVY